VSSLTLTSLEYIPLIRQGDDLADIIVGTLPKNNLTFEDGDVLVIAQKIVSKAEGRIVNLANVMPSERALKLASQTEKDPRLVELVLQESKEVLRTRPGTIIVEHRLGFVCANAGIDHSNVAPQESGMSTEEWMLLLPENPDRSAERIRQVIQSKTGRRVGILIIDSHGRAWRNGTVGTAIGIAGMPGLQDLRGKADLFGFTLRITQVGVADELAAAASLLMGQAAEGTPVVHVRGFPYSLREGSLQELLRPTEQDLFR
jgi:coenzyme F420-0:L-glutamate ligase/coenzyme F420-1:gamma-L-glutamate ligase